MTFSSISATTSSYTAKNSTLNLAQSVAYLNVLKSLSSYVYFKIVVAGMKTNPSIYTPLFDSSYPSFGTIKYNLDSMVYFLYQLPVFTKSFANPYDAVQPGNIYSNGTYSDNGGLFMHRSVHEIIWGFNNDPIFLGVTNNYTGIFGPNITSVSDNAAFYGSKTAPYTAKKTGLGGSTGTGEYVTYDDKPWITNRTDLGYSCPSTGLCNVWQRSEIITGSNDGFAFQPLHADGASKYTPSTLKIYEANSVRTLNMTYQFDVTYQDIVMHRYFLDESCLANTTINPDNANYYMTGPSGVGPLSTAAGGTPAYISLPNFLQGSNSLREQFSGLPTLYFGDFGSWIDVEPWSGKTMNAIKRLQLNFGITKALFTNTAINSGNYFNVFATQSTSFIWPAGWAEESGIINQDDANSFAKVFVYLPNSLSILSLAFIIIGAIIMGITLIHFIMICCRSNEGASLSTNNVELPAPSTTGRLDLAEFHPTQ